MRRSELGGRCSAKSDDLYKKLNASHTTKVAHGGALAQHDGEQRRRERLVRWQHVVADDISGKHQAIVVRSGRLVQASARDDETVVVHPCKLDELEMVDAQVGGEVALAGAAGKAVGMQDGVAHAGERVALLLVVEVSDGDAVVDVLPEQHVAKVEVGLGEGVGRGGALGGGGRVVHAGVAEGGGEGEGVCGRGGVAVEEPVPDAGHGEVVGDHVRGEGGGGGGGRERRERHVEAAGGEGRGGTGRGGEGGGGGQRAGGGWW
ncbi:pherophorin-C1 protein precursor [Gracilaria domingensis]|nr:pherophorin-C1 protein precursor [Gracilaria domingensis]